MMPPATTFRWLLLSGAIALSVLAGFGRGSAAPELSSTVASCLEEALGSERFAAVRAAAEAGKTVVLTDRERTATQACVKQPSDDHADQASATNQKSGLSPELLACLEHGIPNFTELRARAEAGEQIVPSAAMRAAAEACFAQFGQPEFQGRKDHGAEQNPQLMHCIEETLGPERFAAVKNGGAEPTQAEMRQVESKCMNQYNQIEPPADREETRRPEGLTDAQQVCLIQIVGEQRVRAMESGSAVPTAAEREKIGQVCFGESGAQHDASSGGESRGSASYNPDSLPEPIKICLKQVFGDDALDRMKSGELSPSQSDMAKMEECSRAFYQKEATPSPSATATKSENSRPESEDSQDCVKRALGDHYTGYRNGTYGPTQDEYAKMKVCFNT